MDEIEDLREASPIFPAEVLRVSGSGNHFSVLCRWCGSFGSIRPWPSARNQLVFNQIWSMWDETLHLQPEAMVLWQKMVDCNLSCCPERRHSSISGSWSRVRVKFCLRLQIVVAPAVMWRLYWDILMKRSGAWGHSFCFTGQPTFQISPMSGWRKEWDDTQNEFPPSNRAQP